MTELPAVPGDSIDGFTRKLEFCKQLVASGFLPQGVNTPAKALAIIEAGRELGIPPMQSLRQINVIQQKPTLSAELMMALMHRGGIRCEWLADTEKEARLKATRKNGTTYTGSFTLAEAQVAGLLTKDGWKKYPKAMMRARVISLVARVIAPDLIGGMYTPEEMGADVNEEGEVLATPGAAPLPLPSETAALPAASPFEADSWVQEFGAALSIDDVDQAWAALTKTFKLTWLGFSPQEQYRIAEAMAQAKTRLSGGPNAG